MKRTIALVLFTACMFTLCACGSSSSSNTTPATKVTEEASITSEIFTDVLPGQLLSDARALYEGKEGYETSEGEVSGLSFYTVEAANTERGFKFFDLTGLKLGINYDPTKGRIIYVNSNIYLDVKDGAEVSAIQADLLKKLEVYGAPIATDIKEKSETYLYLVKINGIDYYLQFSTMWGPYIIAFKLALPNNQTTTSAQAEQPAPTKAPESSPAPIDDGATLGQKNALKKAQSYLSFSAFSRSGLIKQLEFEGFKSDECEYAVDHCKADWSEEAVKKAKSYLDFSAFSKSGLIKQLEFEGFTTEEAQHGAENCGADWNEQAVKKAQSYLSFSSFSRSSLIKQLEFEGFTTEQAEYAVNEIGY